MQVKNKITEEKIRIDQYLSTELDMSRSKCQKLIKEEKVLINGKKIPNNYQLKKNDNIEIIGEVEEVIDIKAEDIPLDIVYEDDDLLIVNKKSGMVVHPAVGNYSKTLVNALMYRFSLSVGTSKLRPGIVHRIDKDTSGLLIVAKNDWAHEQLSEMIKNKDVERKYIALVDGIIPHETGSIDAPIGRDENNRQRMMVTNVNAKDSITHFKVLKRYQNQTIIECKLETGRTHQIRVHMKYIGYPIYNDPVYGKTKNPTDFGQFLHSYSIKFIHPRTKKEIYYEVDVPTEFREYLDSLEKKD